MTRGTTPRLALLTSSSVSDTMSTQDILDDNTKLEAAAAIYGTGTRAARPSPGKVGRFYRATDTGALFWDDGTTWQDADARSGAVAATWTPQAFSGATAGTASPWDNGQSYTSGKYLLSGGYCTVTAAVDPGTNGPAFGVAAPAYVKLPTAAVGLQVGQDIGGYTYCDVSGNPIGAGRVIWAGVSGNGPLGACVAANGGGLAQLGTSNRYRMTYTLTYPVA